MVCVDECVFEVDGGGREGVVVDELVDGDGQCEVEVQVVLAGEVVADSLC